MLEGRPKKRQFPCRASVEYPFHPKARGDRRQFRIDLGDLVESLLSVLTEPVVEFKLHRHVALVFEHIGSGLQVQHLELPVQLEHHINIRPELDAGRVRLALDRQRLSGQILVG